LSEPGCPLPGINTIEVDQGVQGMNAPKSVSRIASMADEPVYLAVYDAIKLEKPLLRKI